MTFATQRFICFSAIAAAAAVGCMSSPSVSERGPPGPCGQPVACPQPVHCGQTPVHCGQAPLHSGQAPAHCHAPQETACDGDYDDDDYDTGTRRWSREWYEESAGYPIGARQKYHHGKLWPPYPRPTGDEVECSHRYHASHYWPWPYNCADQAYVRDVTAMSIENGWIDETTLYEYHFDAEIHELNHAGMMQLRWILENAPHHRRMVFVQTAMTPHASHARLASARNNAIVMVGEENLPPIIQRVATPYGRPALEVNRIRQAEIGSMLPPRIQYTAPRVDTN